MKKENNGNKLLGARFFDGAMGTLLAERYGSVPPGELIFTAADFIREIHTGYLKAGADVISANTFGAAGESFSAAAVKFAVKTAKEAVNLAGRGLVALDLGPTGGQMPPAGTLSFDEAYSRFSAAVKAGTAAGADLVLLETFGSLYELKAAVCAAKHSCKLPVFASMTLDANGKSLCGADLKAMAALLDGLGADAMGLNCGVGPETAAQLAAQLLKITNTPVIVQANAGLPRIENGKAVYDFPPSAFAAAAAGMAAAGVRYIGGCCGTGLNHISETVKAVNGLALQPPPVNDNAAVICATGYSRYAEYLPGISRIFKASALNKEDALDEAFNAEEEGAEFLLLKTAGGGNSLAERAAYIQSFINLPLILCGAGEELTEAVRIYNGSPLILPERGGEATAAVAAALWGGRVVSL